MHLIPENMTLDEFIILQRESDQEKEELQANSKAVTSKIIEMNTIMSEEYFKAISGCPVPSLIKSIKSLVYRVESGEVSQLHFYENLKFYLKRIEEIIGY